MGGKQRIYKQRIRSTQTLGKVFRAMELIAASRIGSAKSHALEGTPYANALSRAVSTVVNHAYGNHGLMRERLDTNRVAILVITSDRGMAGAYSAAVLRESERLAEGLESKGKIPVLYVVGRRGASYFRFRGREVVQTWEGHSDSPQASEATEIADLLRRVFRSKGPDGVSEIYVVYTHFMTMVRQVVQVHRIIPIEVIDKAQIPDSFPVVPVAIQKDAGNVELARPLYQFEPDADSVLAVILPLQVRARIHNMLLHAAASELASRQRAMHTATENAGDLILEYTRLANSARQSEITQEISEIVSGADALASSS